MAGVRDFIRTRSFFPRKRLGQNFLIDAHIADHIVAAVGLSPTDNVIEIGPGLGALTFRLASKAQQVIAVEKDRALSAHLTAAAARTPNIRVIAADILDAGFDSYAESGKAVVVGNIPYSVTTPILIQLVSAKRSVDTAVLTMQREVADRLVARPGSKAYGSITCLLRYHAEAKIVRIVSPGSFYPRPEVESAVVRFEMRGTPKVSVRGEDLFFTVIRKSFNQRRKGIVNSLVSRAMGEVASSKAVVESALESAGVKPSARPEELTLEEFARIADALFALRS